MSTEIKRTIIVLKAIRFPYYDYTQRESRAVSLVAKPRMSVTPSPAYVQ